MATQCTKCGAAYDDAFARDWGRTKESDGMGPEAVCVALIEAVNAPKAESRQGGRLVLETPVELCRGRLNQIADRDAGELVKPTPIEIR